MQPESPDPKTFRIGAPAPGPVPLYRQIQEQVRLAVACGRLRPGDRLEPVREAANRLAINPGTVARAYRELELTGIIRTNRRLGSRIAPVRGEELAAHRRARLLTSMERTLVEGLAEGFSPEELEAAFTRQLAAWRERRAPRAESGGGIAGRDRPSRFAGSHDLALEALWARFRDYHPAIRLEVRYVGSLDGLVQLLHGTADMAGVHILDEETGEYNTPILRRLFPGQRLCLVTLAGREQGLLVPPGNPRRLRDITGLARPGVRFANRPPGSGTRSLLECLLRRAGVPASAVRGYDREFPDHLAVAGAVAKGLADAGLGLRAAARAFGLDFVPLAAERFDLALRVEDRQQPALSGILALLRDESFHSMLGAMTGYDTACTGQETIV